MQRWLRRQSRGHARSRSWNGPTISTSDLGNDDDNAMLIVEEAVTGPPRQLPESVHHERRGARPRARTAGQSSLHADATTQTQVSSHIDDTEVVAELHRIIIADDANQLVKLLVGKEIDADSTFTRTERPILHVAASLGAHDCLGYLIRLGAAVNKQDSAGRTALHLAARNGHRRIIEVLIKQFDADVRVADAEGYTAMHWLASNGHLTYLDLLLSLGPSVNLEDRSGRTALHVACHGAHAACAQYLVSKGADVQRLDKHGRNALHYACKVGAVDCCEFLLKLGSVLVTDTDGIDPLLAALVGRHAECASRLITAFPQLLARLVRYVAMPEYDVDAITQTLRIHARNSPAALKVTAEALAQLVSTGGQQLLCFKSNEREASDAFMRAVQVLQHLIGPGTVSVPSRQPSSPPGRPRGGKAPHHVTTVRRDALEIVSTMWTALRECLDRVLMDIEAAADTRACYSPHCRVGGTCYSSSCRRGQGTVAEPISSDRKQQYHHGGSTSSRLACTAASRIVTMLSAFYTLHKRDDGALDPIVHTFFATHRRVVTWLIERDVSVLFQRLNFILGHECLHHLFRNAIRSEPFEVRQAWFFEHLLQEEPVENLDWAMPVLTVSRKNLFKSSCELFLTPHEARTQVEREEEYGPPTLYEHKRPFAVRFEAEPGIGDGVKREWFELLVREIVNPNYGLFMPSADNLTYQPNPDSSINPDHLSYLEFAGRIVGLALYHRHPLSVHFTRSFYKHMLGKPASYQDAESVDPEYMQSINWILENDIADAGLDLNFSTEHQSFGRTEHVELLPGGADIPVTDENKHGYVQLLVAQKLSTGIRKQIGSFTKGLWSFIPRPLLSLFDEFELELLISGVPTIDVEDWRANCHYTGYTEHDPAVRMFWEVMTSFEQPERALVLQFSTGSSRVPIGGFANLGGGPDKQFTISRDDDPQRLPSASTCFYLLRLPEYESVSVLRDKLLLALRDAAEGFAFS